MEKYANLLATCTTDRALGNIDDISDVCGAIWIGFVPLTIAALLELFGWEITIDVLHIIGMYFEH